MNGKIVVIKEPQQISDSFKKREFVLEYAENPQYPELIPFELVQDKCDLINGFNVGDRISVDFNYKGKKWTNPATGEVRYFLSLQPWKISGFKNQEAQTQPQETQGDSTDDLPF